MISHLKINEDEPNSLLLRYLILFITVGFAIALTFLSAGWEALVTFAFWLVQRNHHRANDATGNLYYWENDWIPTTENPDLPIDLLGSMTELIRQQNLELENLRLFNERELETMRSELRGLVEEPELLNEIPPAEPRDADRSDFGVPFPFMEDLDLEISNRIEDISRMGLEEELYDNAVAEIADLLLTRNMESY